MRPGVGQIHRRSPGNFQTGLFPGNHATLHVVDLKALSSSGLSVRVTPTHLIAGQGDGREITLTVMGPDRLGIVKEISHALAERRINVVDMDSHVRSAPMSAELIFQARIDAQIPKDTDLEDLHDSLDEIANHMTLEIDLE